MRRFITNFAEVVKYITNMLRKDSDFKWSVEAKKYFVDIMKALTKALVLVSPNFSKEFMVFSFSSEHTITGVLLQKNEQNLEQPIVGPSRCTERRGGESVLDKFKLDLF